MQPTAQDHIELFGPQTTNFIEENNLNAESVLALLVDWGKGRKTGYSHINTNHEDLLKAIRSRKPSLFRRLYFYYGGCGGLLFPFFFTFITKKASWRCNLGLLLSGLFIGLFYFHSLSTSVEFELARCIHGDFMRRTTKELKKIFRLGKMFFEDMD